MKLRRPHATKIALMGSTLYVAAVSLRAHDGRGVLLWCLVIGALVCAWIAANVLPTSRRRGLALYGLALALAAADAGGHRVVFALAGVGLATYQGVSSILEARGLGGLAEPVRAPVRLDRAVVALFVLALAPALQDAIGMTVHFPVSASTASGFALGGSYALMGLAALDRVRRGPHELGAHVRAFGALIGTGCAAIVGLFAASALPGAHFSPLEVSLAVAAVIAVYVSEHMDPLRTVKRARRAATLVLFAGPVVLISTMMADSSLLDARLAVLLAVLATALVAWFSHVLEEPMLPARGAWLSAFDKAQAALARLDGEEAIAAVLSALREPTGEKGPSPALYLLHPARILKADSGGYLSEKPGEAPPHLTDLARIEPEATLRHVCLGRLFVRRADLRPISRWMSDGGIDVATVVTHEGEPEGLLVLGFGGRTDQFTLEEVVALKRLADKLASVCAMRARTLRGLLREQALAKTVEDTEDKLARIAHESQVSAARYVATTTRLAEPMTLGFYSASSRLAYDNIERRVAQSAPLVIMTPSGVEAVPYVARAHLAGPRKNGPFVVVDGTRTREHDIQKWSDPNVSPFAIAHGGVLFLLDGAALPLDVQALIGRILAERRAPWPHADALDIVLGFSSTQPPDALADILEPSLYARLEDGIAQAVHLPRLSERPEDLRAIVSDRLAREGLRVRGAPVGIDDRAFARLLAYPFPGEDAELRAIATRLVMKLAGDVVRAADVEALKLDEPDPNNAEKSGESGHIFLVK